MSKIHLVNWRLERSLVFPIGEAGIFGALLLTNSLFTSEAIETHIIALLRVLFALSAIVSLYVHPTEPDRFITVTYIILAFYTVYSVIAYILSRGHSQFVHFLQSWGHWVDVAWYAVLITLCSGTNIIFLFGFFFTILIASFQRGFVSGLSISLICAVTFAFVGLMILPKEPNFGFGDLLLRPTYLMVLGFVISCLGGLGMKLKRRLTLLKEITSLFNPRFGVDRTIGLIMEQLCTFHNVERCLLVLPDQIKGFNLLRVDSHDLGSPIRTESIPTKLAHLLISLPSDVAVVYTSNLNWWEHWWGNYYAYDVAKGKSSREGRQESESIAVTLDANSFASVPVCFRSQGNGRLYLVSRRRRFFNNSDLDFLLQVIAHVMPVIDNIRLVDQLAVNAAEEERRRIARDIHDTVIQPYIGLQLGLAAIRLKLTAIGADVNGDIDRMIEMASAGITELRSYVGRLKGNGEQEGSLVPAVRRFAGKFAEATGIAVQVATESNIYVDGRLAAEAFQIVAEGLSNIRRHTHATNATVRLENRDGSLILGIENDGGDGQNPKHFTPRSISERSEALGGHTFVEQRNGSGTVVVVEIPL